ncbi:MAG: hypothetical protein UW11_C0006G0031 [Parcubacteria group bacterium GW2011_GWA2_43_9b]|nr:MAG: hypothetical protein UW11_C0006G0031 [Parcubacteria group bacterium GW2011_GWA2_43_9b]
MRAEKIENFMKIIIERQKCIGCGSCVAVCDKYFEMADDRFMIYET